MLSNEKIPWKRLSAEAVAIVASILLAFAIDTWWEDLKDAELESGYLVSIREDFEANRALLERSIARYENIIRSMTALLEQSALSEPNLEVTELNQKFSLIQSMPTFFRITRTYENLTGSGNLNVIQSGKLKNALADYYANAERILLVQESHEMELVQTFQPYIIEHLDYSAVHYSRVDEYPLPPPVNEKSILEVLNTQQFRNILTQKWMISTDLLSEYRDQLELTNGIIETLDSLGGN